MNPLTIILVFATAGALVTYDFWTYLERGSRATISYNSYKLAQCYPLISFALGVLCGHLFWLQCGVCN